MLYTWLINSFLFCTFFYLQKPQKILLYTSSKVTFNTEYLEDHSLTIGPNNQTLDIILNIAQDLNSDPWVEITIKSLKNSAYRTIFQYDINICHIFGKQGAVNFVSAWMNNFWKYGDLPKSCPVKKVGEPIKICI